MVVHGLDPEAALAAVFEDVKITDEPRPYTSAVLPDGATITGTPSALERIRAATSFQGFKLTPIPVFGPYQLVVDPSDRCSLPRLQCEVSGTRTL